MRYTISPKIRQPVPVFPQFMEPYYRNFTPPLAMGDKIVCMSDTPPKKNRYLHLYHYMQELLIIRFTARLKHIGKSHPKEFPHLFLEELSGEDDELPRKIEEAQRKAGHGQAQTIFLDPYLAYIIAEEGDTLIRGDHLAYPYEIYQVGYKLVIKVNLPEPVRVETTIHDAYQHGPLLFGILGCMYVNEIILNFTLSLFLGGRGWDDLELDKILMAQFKETDRDYTETETAWRRQKFLTLKEHRQNLEQLFSGNFNPDNDQEALIMLRQFYGRVPNPQKIYLVGDYEWWVDG